MLTVASRRTARAFLRTLVWLYRRTGGKVGGSMAGAPVLLLTTTGRKSGRPWTVPVIYQPDGDHWVLIASNGGNPKHPGWWLNLSAHPDAAIEIGRDTYAVTATEATGDERERLWRRMTDVYKGYDKYAEKTTRTIPVVLLTRR
jgi:F420H(2)-dependent quinone reductase